MVPSAPSPGHGVHTRNSGSPSHGRRDSAWDALHEALLPACSGRLSVAFTVNGKAGKNSFKFRGRIGGRMLKRGRYRLSSVATDAAGNKSAVMRKRFKIVREGRGRPVAART
jgi:hypothetical protein